MDELPLIDRLRLDKWLWAARFFKTRALAAEEVQRGRVRVNGQPAKPARELRAGDTVEIRESALWRVVAVRQLSAVRGPAPLARSLYLETPESCAAREQAAAQRRLAAEPAHAIEHGRPTKRDRRALDASQSRWDRWSASLEDPS